jgi:hypothetical protein
MSTHAHSNKVKVTFECTADERAYIKMLAAKGHMTLNDFLLSCVREYFPKKPNKETREAMKELDEGLGTQCESLEDFWEKMGMNPNA